MPKQQPAVIGDEDPTPKIDVRGGMAGHFSMLSRLFDRVTKTN